MTYVMGIDPSITATGVCVLHDDKPPSYKTCGIKAGKPLALRLWHLQCLVASTVPSDTQPLLACVETPISPLALKGGGGSGFNNNIMAYGEIYSMLGKFRINYVEASPKQRAMVATGGGNADKAAVEAAYYLLADERQFAQPWAENNNEVDAYWLAMIAAEKMSDKFIPYGDWLDLSEKAYDMMDTLEIVELS